MSPHAYRPLLERIESRSLPGDATGWALLAPFTLLADAPEAEDVRADAGLAFAGSATPLPPAVFGGADRPAELLRAPAETPVAAVPDARAEGLHVIASRLGDSGGSIQSVTLRATYLFNDTLDPEQPDAPALLPVDPFGENYFGSEVVYGSERQVYTYWGDPFPDWNAGLVLPTAGLIPADDYSVELVFRFLQEPPTWGRIIDVEDRVSDNGFYVSPDSQLQIWENGGLVNGPTEVQTAVFYHVVMTNSGGTVQAFLDGVLEFTSPPTSVMNVNNPGSYMNFFLDDYVIRGEYSNGQVALVRVYEGALSGEEVGLLAQDPFAYP